MKALLCPFLTILRDSLRGRGVKILAKALYNYLWHALVEVLVTWCQRPLNELVQVLATRSAISSRCPCMISYRSLRRSCGDPVSNST